MCQHVPSCPEADAADRTAARVVAAHPEQGWNLLCNGVILFEDSGQLVPDGGELVPKKPPRQPRPRWGQRRRARAARPESVPSHAIVLAGGRGTRLSPLTRTLPKPLVEIGPYPILEITLRRLQATGVRRVTLCVNHLGHLIEEAIGEGARFGLEIEYTAEDRPLGTAGPLRLVSDWCEPALVLNGDVVSSVDFADLFRRHERSRAALTVAYQQRRVQTSVGMVQVLGDRVLTISEKPSMTWNVVSGIYVADPTVCELIPPRVAVDMPDLVTAMLNRRRPVEAYEFDGAWHDVGTPEKHQQAAREFLADPDLYLRPASTDAELPADVPDISPEPEPGDAPREERWAS
jgi:NDP-mannose synthase